MKRFTGVLLLTLTLGAASVSTVWASHLEKESRPRNVRLHRLYTAMKAFSHSRYGVVAIFDSSQLQGEDSNDSHLAKVEETIIRFLCPQFENGIQMSRAPSSREGFNFAVKSLKFDLNATDEDDRVNAFSHDLAMVLQDHSLEVYAGQASGENATGEILGVYDVKNEQIAFFGFTSCGSKEEIQFQTTQ